MERVGSYDAESDVWVLQGDWERRTLDTQGDLKSLLSRNRWEEAALTGALSGRTSPICQPPHHADLRHSASLIFLYGNTGPNYGLTQVSWIENKTIPSDEPWKVYNGESPVELRGVLAYVGYGPPEGWNSWYIRNLDGRRNGRLVEFTRLDIWKVPPGTE